MEQKLYDAAAKLPVTHAQLDISAVPLKQNNGVRRMALTFAACAAAICLVLFSALFLAGQVNEYRDAVAYFEQYGLSTEGLTHKEIKDVYLDIITGSFSHPKTAGVLASKNPSEEILYCPAPMTKETYKRLFSTESDDWDPSTFWSEDNQDRNLHRYYGTYNGLDVMPQKIQIQLIESYTIAGFDFICNACKIMVKKDGGAGVTLQAAYEKGLLTDKDIEAIYNYHKQTETALYEEYAIYYCPAPLTKQIYCQMFPNQAEYWDPDNFWSADNRNYLYCYYGMYNGYGVITQQTKAAVSQDYTTTIAGFTFITHSSHLVACKAGEMIYLDEAYEQGLFTQQDIESIYNYHMQVESTVPNQTDPEAEMLAQYFDLEKTHRPTMDEVLSIQKGTPVQDAVALLGKPHGFAPSNALATFWWETAEGFNVLVDVGATKNFPSDPEQRTVEIYFKYCDVEWVIPLINYEGEIDYTSKNFDESGIYTAASRYFSQREFYLRWLTSTIANVIAGLVEDEHTHRAAIDAAGIEWLSSDVVIHGIDYWEWYAQVVATETVTYRENGVEKTVAILHRVELTDGDDGEIGTVDDLYFDPIANFKSCSYLEPPYETPQPNLIKPEVETPKSDVEIMQELFEETNGNWYNYMLLSDFRTVSELKASYVLKTDFSLQPHKATEAERAYLEEKLGVDLTSKYIYGYTPEAINSILQQYVGATMDQVDASDLVYWEETGMYYGVRNSETGKSAYVYCVEHKADGTIWVYYRRYLTAEWEEAVVVLKKSGADYQICSNFPARMMIEDPDSLKMQELFDHAFGDRYYSNALRSSYTTPADVDLSYLFRKGFADEPGITQREKELLIEKVPNPNVVGGYLRLPAEKIDAKLMELFGITLQQTNQVGMDDWIYLEETNCYYKRDPGTSNATIQVERVEYKADGTVLVYYDRMFKRDKMVVALKPNGSTYRILSNLPEVEYMEPDKAAAWRIAEEKLALYQRWMNFGIICDYEPTDYIDMSRFLTEEQKKDYCDFQYRLLCCHTIEEAKAHVKQLVSDEINKGTLDDNLFTDDQGNVYTIVNPTELPHFEYCTLLEYSDTRIVATVEVWVYELTSVKTFILEKIDGNFIITSVETERR